MKPPTRTELAKHIARLEKLHEQILNEASALRSDLLILRRFLNAQSFTPSNTDPAIMVIDEVAMTHGFTREAIQSKAKPSALAWARHTAVYLAHKLTRYSGQHLGRMFKHDHACIRHSLIVATQRIATDQKYAYDVHELYLRLFSKINDHALDQDPAILI